MTGQEQELNDPKFYYCGDSAISVSFGETISEHANDMVMSLDRVLQASQISGIVESVPTYCALLVHIDPVLLEPAAAVETLRRLVGGLKPDDRPRRSWRVPVVYGGRFGLDLGVVAEHCGLGPNEFVRRHSACDYRVSMIGFLPGFSYLSGLPEELAMTRRRSPRDRIPASSIAIGGIQAAIGSVPGPSGWRLIGRTPARPFMPDRKPIFLFEPGDAIRFVAITADEWAELDRAAGKGHPVISRVSV